MKPMRKKTLLVIPIIFIIFAFAVFTMQCSKDDEDNNVNQLRKIKKKSIKPVISRVDIDPPNPTSSDFIRAVPQLEDPRMEFVEFHYQWYVNGDKVEGEQKALLGKKHCKKGDTVYCRVYARRGKGKAAIESEIVTGKKVKIGNSKPIINFIPVGKFGVPGLFKYSIDAKDPDGDELSYHLVSPLDYGIHLDSQTGEINWNIPELAEVRKDIPPPSMGDESSSMETSKSKNSENQIPSVVQILFEVKDSDGAVARSAISLNLQKGEEIPE